MKINFRLPGRGLQFAGGFQVMYNYATEMALRGHDVCVIHTPYRDIQASPLQQMKANVAYCLGVLNRNFWLVDKLKHYEQELRLSWIPKVTDRHMPDADATVISYWRSADYVNLLSPSKGRHIYLFQEFEKYMSEEDSIKSRFRQALEGDYEFLAISPAATELLESFGKSDVGSMPNGLDTLIHYTETPLASDQRNAIGFPYRLESLKRSDLAIAVLQNIHNTRPEIRVWSFGPPHHGQVPGWMEYYEHPENDELRSLLNQSKVFVTPSDYEGWGLPGCEAMACGAALASTDHGGVHAYAVNGLSALISPRGDADALQANIEQLLDDEEARLKMAQLGQESMQQFSMAKSYDRFEQALTHNQPAH